MMENIQSMVTLMVILIVGGTLLIFIGTFVIIFLFNRNRRKKAEQLLASGVQGQAEILTLQDTGMRVNDNPRIKLGLQVEIPNHAPYQIEKTMVVPMIRMAQLQVGSKVRVVVDPNQLNNPDKLGLLLQ
jgi:hypothetical protein